MRIAPVSGVVTLARVTSQRRDHLFPSVHPRPARGWVNDPNGPVLVDGVWHLWYQYHPLTRPTDPVQWGHASSTDLAHWTLHRPSIVPQPGSADEDGAWSGNTVDLGDGTIAAFYSGHVRSDPFQPPVRADSVDGGRSFGPPRPTAPRPGGEERVVQLRDPFVWAQDGGWRMALGQEDADGRPAVRLAASDDLETWSTLGLIGSAEPGSVGAGLPLGSMWECPQVVDLDGRRVVLAAVMGTGVGVEPDGSGFGPVIALVGERDDPADGGLGDYVVHPVDSGDALYAPSAYRDAPGGPLVWGWLIERRDESWWVEDDWAGLLSLPRVLTLGDDGSPRFAPAPQLESLRARELAFGDVIPHAVEVATSGAAVLRFAFGAEESLEVRGGPDGLVVDRSRSSLDARADLRPLRIEGDDPTSGGEVRIFLDGSALEVFTPSGRVLTTRVYPTAGEGWTLQVEGGTARAWALE